MTRAPFQVVVLPYRRAAPQPEFAVFRRRDAGYWQFIAGGGEGLESPLEAAHREAHEEAGLPLDHALLQLRAIASVPVSAFRAVSDWPADLYVVPVHHFAADCTGRDLNISEEHTDFRWAAEAGVVSLLQWQSEAVALGELAARLRDGRA